MLYVLAFDAEGWEHRVRLESQGSQVMHCPCRLLAILQAGLPLQASSSANLPLQHMTFASAISCLQDPHTPGQGIGAAEAMFRDLNRHGAAVVEGLPEVLS